MRCPLLLLALFAQLATGGFLLPLPFVQRPTPKSSDDNTEAEKDAEEKPAEAPKRQEKRLRPLALTLALTGHMHLGAALVTFPRSLVWLWRRLPPQLPTWWRAHGLTTDAFGQVAFMLSNVAYLGAGAQLLLTPQAPRSMGVLMLVVCVASCAYHAAQCLHGCGSEPASRACTIDTVLAVGTACFFVTQVHVEPANVGLAVLSLAFFKDAFGLGYTATHSLWHFSTAGAAIVSRPRLVRAAVEDLHPLRRLPQQIGGIGPAAFGAALGQVRRLPVGAALGQVRRLPSRLGGVASRARPAKGKGKGKASSKAMSND